MILGMDFTLGSVISLQTGIRGKPQIELLSSELNSILVPTHVSYRAVMEEVKTPFGQTIMLYPGEKRTLKLPAPKPKASGILPILVEVARWQFLENCVEQVTFFSDDGKQVLSCLYNDTQWRVSVPDDLWLATYLFPKHPQFGREIKEVDLHATVCPPTILQCEETAKTVIAKHISLNESVRKQCTTSPWMNQDV